MIVVVRWLLIFLAVLLSPLYLAWLCGGMIADRIERNRRRRVST
jgi:hypothetical protein